MKKRYFLLLIPIFMITYIMYQRTGLPVVGYHSVVSDELKESDYSDDPYTISVSTFTQQMQYLYDQGYQTLTMEEVADYYYHDADIPSKSVVITIDDGHIDTYTVIKPILEKYGFVATAFVIGSKVDSVSSNYTYLTSDMLEENDTIAYYSHTYDLHHRDQDDNAYVTVLSKEDLLIDYQSQIVSNDYFAYPYGISSELCKEVLEEQGTILAFSYNQFHSLKSSDDAYDLPRYMLVDIMPLWYFKIIVK
ncbi:polysaccharide deacetylase family protein [Tannockella kyphosi]|uniref:polysaccharide deacetylase family protein n=1 Tax=Tannockella kyphosi TaxID=2899121 RepID=UPI0020112390|nr:polysaccharide deacetylase family protein [Tannockella kyphosi]